MSLHRLRELIENYAQSYADAQGSHENPYQDEYRLRDESRSAKNELEIEIERIEKLLGDE